MSIEYFAESESGLLFVANGYDSMKFWDGNADQFVDVGMDAPADAITIGGSGNGPIVGAYQAYLRFVDQYGNVSNLNPISNTYEATGGSGTITNATNASPIVVTSPGHGLTNGAIIKIINVGGNTSANNTWPVTVIDANTVSLDNSHGTATYTSGGTWTSGVAQITYSAVPAPAEAKVVRRQILRNTDGQETTFYVDVDTTDLSTATFVSTQTDEQLSANEAVPLLDSTNRPFANRHDKPDSIYGSIIAYRGRMFAMGVEDYTMGHCKMTFGSAVVTGVGTDWKQTFANRELHVDGALKVYTIDSVDETEQTLTLTEPFAGLTNLFAFYAISPAPAFRRNIAYSEAGLPQSWPPINGLTIPDTGDELVGGFAMRTFLYVLEKRHISKITFFADPQKDSGVYQSIQRGCVNKRCFVVVDENAYVLDELGIYRFGGGTDIEKLSEQIQSIFQDNEGTRPYQINWKRSETFFATHDKQRRIIRWFVVLDGSLYPRHALCYHYVLNRWWPEEFPFPMGGGCSGEMQGRPLTFLGGQHHKVLAGSIGSLDMVNPGAHNTHGVVTAATAFTLTDVTATFQSLSVNAPVTIVNGRGLGQTRRIVKVTGGTMRISTPWLIMPDTTSVYQIGAVHWNYISQFFRFSPNQPNEQVNQCRFEFVFEPVKEKAFTALRFNQDDGSPEKQAMSQSFKDGGGIACTKGDPNLIIDMTQKEGLVDRQLPGFKEFYIRGKRYTQFELEGWTNSERARLYVLLYEGVIPGIGLGQTDPNPPQK